MVHILKSNIFVWRHLAYLIKEAAGWGSEGAEDERAVAFAEASEEEESGEGVTRETACSEEGEDGGGILRGML